ncbi:MAG: hypothetical protein H6679_00210 [Epsilonproteobacteria bacterium]|nr:hypothetical protein [Campylobacterota bacterium]
MNNTLKKIFCSSILGLCLLTSTSNAGFGVYFGSGSYAHPYYGYYYGYPSYSLGCSRFSYPIFTSYTVDSSSISDLKSKLSSMMSKTADFAEKVKNDLEFLDKRIKGLEEGMTKLIEKVESK